MTPWRRRQNGCDFAIVGSGETFFLSFHGNTVICFVFWSKADRTVSKGGTGE